MKTASKLYSQLLVIAFIATACSHIKPVSPTTRLFPDGRYNQSIQLEISPKDGDKMFIPFTSLSEIKNGNYKMLGLTPFGTKAFEAQGNINKPDTMFIKVHTKLPKSINLEFIKKTMGQIQGLQNLKRKQLKKATNFDFFKDEEIELKIFKYTSQGIPSSMVLKNNHWKAFIKTSSYKEI